MSLDGFVALLDAVAVDLVPVELGTGRPSSTGSDQRPALLDAPTTTVHGDRVTHLCFPVRR